MGTIFAGAKHFVVEGGTFNINQAAPNNLPSTHWKNFATSTGQPLILN
jgi:hypothetical protein